MPFDSNVLQPGPMFKPQMRYMKVPAHAVGTIIGRNGETIRDLQQRSGAVIHLDASRATQSDDSECLVYINGSEAAAKIAQGLIEDVVAKGSARFVGIDRREQAAARAGQTDDVGGTDSSLGAHRGGGVAEDNEKQAQEGSTNGETHTADRSDERESGKDDENNAQEECSDSQKTQEGNSQSVENEQAEQNDGISTNVEKAREDVVTLEMSIADAKVGMIIGKRGATIKQLQHLSGTKIAVSKEMDESLADRPRVVRITGTRSHVEEARRLILGRIDRPVENIAQEGSDGNSGDTAENEQMIAGFRQAGFGGAVGMTSDMAQFHAMGLPVSPIRVTHVPQHGRGVNVMPQSGMGVRRTSGFSGTMGQEVDAEVGGMAERYVDDGYFGGAYAAPYESSGPLDAMSARNDAAPHGEQEHKESVDKNGETQKTDKAKVAVSDSLTESQESEKEER